VDIVHHRCSSAKAGSPVRSNHGTVILYQNMRFREHYKRLISPLYSNFLAHTERISTLERTFNGNPLSNRNVSQTQSSTNTYAHHDHEDNYYYLLPPYDHHGRRSNYTHTPSILSCQQHSWYQYEHIRSRPRNGLASSEERDNVRKVLRG
jgi:hypothetical protein